MSVDAEFTDPGGILVCWYCEGEIPGGYVRYHNGAPFCGQGCINDFIEEMADATT